MAISAQSILTRVVEVLQDTANDRWKIDELCRLFNDAQRLIQVMRPDLTATTQSWALSVGTRQTLPATAARLIEPVRNTAGKKRVIRLAPRALIDATLPNWQNMTPATEIVHVMYDLRDPRTAYVYPPAATGASIEAVFSLYPTDIAVPAPTAVLADVTGNMDFDDQYKQPMIDMVLFLAYSKDAEIAGNAQRAADHFQSCASLLGVDLKAAVVISPDQMGNSNRPPAAV